MRETIAISLPRSGSKPVNCHIIGDPGDPPVLFAGGVAYAKTLAKLASLFKIKFIYAEFPYWHGKSISSMGYASVTDITLDSMLEDLQAVVQGCIAKGHIPCDGKDYSYAVAGGSYPGWLAMVLKNRDPHCIGLNLFATPVPGKDPVEWEKEKAAYLKANDLRGPEEQRRLADIKQEVPGIRATLLAELKAVELQKTELKAVSAVAAASDSPSDATLPPEQQLIKNYFHQNGPLFWQNPRCDDRVFWQGEAVSGDFFQRFFEIIFSADSALLRPSGEILIIAGLHDFTIPYDAWIKFFLDAGAKPIMDMKPEGKSGDLVAAKEAIGMLFNYQGMQVRVVCSIGGHLPHMVEGTQAEVKSSSSIAGGGKREIKKSYGQFFSPVMGAGSEDNQSHPSKADKTESSLNSSGFISQLSSPALSATSNSSDSPPCSATTSIFSNLDLGSQSLSDNLIPPISLGLLASPSPPGTSHLSESLSPLDSNRSLLGSTSLSGTPSPLDSSRSLSLGGTSLFGTPHLPESADFMHYSRRRFSIDSASSTSPSSLPSFTADRELVDPYQRWSSRLRIAMDVKKSATYAGSAASLSC